MADTRSQLAQAVVAWLKDPETTAAVSSDKRSELDKAAQSVASAFGSSTQASGGPGLQTIYDVFLKTQQKMGSAAPSGSSTAGSSSAAGEGTTAPAPASAEDQAAAEQHKTDGNKSMSAKDYGAAIASYGKAIDLHKSPVYYSNRAAAYSQVGQHDKAVQDARDAAKIDPSFAKAYSRLGHALFSSGKYEEAVEAYQQGLLVDPENKLMQSGLDTAKKHASQASGSSSAENASSSPATRDGGASAGAGAGANPMAGFPGMGGGGGGGGGGMPDLASLMVSSRSCFARLMHRIQTDITFTFAFFATPEQPHDATNGTEHDVQRRSRAADEQPHASPNGRQDGRRRRDARHVAVNERPTDARDGKELHGRDGSWRRRRRWWRRKRWWKWGWQPWQHVRLRRVQVVVRLIV